MQKSTLNMFKQQQQQQQIVIYYSLVYNLLSIIYIYICFSVLCFNTAQFKHVEMFH